jgi:ribA/ribD-fused uncharacterized protein
MTFSQIDPRWAVSQTATHVFFLGGPFSQWFPCRFLARAPFSDNDQEIAFNCAEQYMMAAKAMLFGDVQARDAIMASTTPKDQKALGRQVRGFDQDRWADAARKVVTEGNIAKFSQNGRLREYLFSTGEKMLVEGAWYDPVWGVKLAWDDPRIVDPVNWQGTNWLGQCLMETRAVLLNALMVQIDTDHLCTRQRP